MRERGADAPLTTPDGRYLVVRGRLWRRTNPGLAPEERERLVRALMAARRAVAEARRADDAAALRAAGEQVHAAKVALGERGPTWWDDGAPDYNRRLAKNTPYADWFAAASESAPKDMARGSGGARSPARSRRAASEAVPKDMARGSGGTRSPARSRRRPADRRARGG